VIKDPTKENKFNFITQTIKYELNRMILIEPLEGSPVIAACLFVPCLEPNGR